MITIFITVYADNSQCEEVQVTAQQLNVRSTPNLTANIVGTLQKNDTVCGYTKNGKWLQIDQGWVSIKYLAHVQQQSYVKSPNNTTNANVNVQSLPSAISKNNTAFAKSNMNDEIATSLFVLVIAIYIVMLMVGMAGKVVVYFDEADLVISLLPWLTLFVSFIIVSIYQPTEQDLNTERMLQMQQFVWYIGGTLATGFAIWAIQLSIKYNRSIPLGLLYGVFKLLSGLIGVSVLISQIFTMKDEKTKRKDFWFAVLVFGAFWWLGKKLINGKQVYSNKGWSLVE